jgi:hypothetical protein
LTGGKEAWPMPPWWKTKTTGTRHCVRCHGTEEVHRRLCRACRARLLAEEATAGEPPRPPEHEAPHHPPEVEPPHSRPWVHRGGG